MEQTVRKKQIVILAAGGIISVALAAAHYLSPIARGLSANADVELVLLSKERPMLFIYHSFSKTVNAVRLPAGAARGSSAYQRAGEVLSSFFGAGVPAGAPSYIEVQAPDMDAFEDLLNNWRARPAQLGRLVRWLAELRKSDATNLTAHDMALLALELSRMNSSNFIKEDLDNSGASAAAKKGAVPGNLPAVGADRPAGLRDTVTQRPGAPVSPAAGEPSPAAAAVRLEVLNASGKTDLAAQVTKLLRKKGFDVINFGTYGRRAARTKIINCSGDLKAARSLRAALDLGGLEIYSKSDKMTIAQVRIILGEDFDGSKIEK